jgi:hypothetical protein
MDNLPHELIAAIGDFLAPKWRLRLFLCRKEWARECIWPQRDLFDWHSRMFLVHKNIHKIQYMIVNTVDGAISRRLSPYTGEVYSEYTIKGEPRVFSLTIIYTNKQIHCYGSYVDSPNFYTQSTDETEIETQYINAKLTFINTALHDKNKLLYNIFNTLHKIDIAVSKCVVKVIMASRKIRKFFAKLH